MKNLNMYENVSADVKMIKEMSNKLAYGELSGVGKYTALEAITDCSERLGNDVTYFKEMCNEKIKMLQEDRKSNIKVANTHVVDDIINGRKILDIIFNNGYSTHIDITDIYFEQSEKSIDKFNELQIENDALQKENLKLKEALKMKELEVIHAELEAFINKD